MKHRDENRITQYGGYLLPNYYTPDSMELISLFDDKEAFINLCHEGVECMRQLVQNDKIIKILNFQIIRKEITIGWKADVLEKRRKDE